MKPERVLAAFVVVVLVCSAGIVGVAVAADNPGLFDFEPREVEAEPGETVEVDVTLQAIALHDDGVESFQYTIAYDPDVLSVVDVERGPWLEAGNETDIIFEASIDDDEGRVTVEQARDPPAGGASGTGTTATLTFEVATDAPPADAFLQFEDTDVQLLEYPLPALEREGVVHVDGGGDARIPLESDDEEDEEAGVTLADDTPDDPEPTPEDEGDATDESDSEAEGESQADDPAEADPDDQAGFGPAVALSALVAVAFLLAMRRRSS